MLEARLTQTPAGIRSLSDCTANNNDEYYDTLASFAIIIANKHTVISFAHFDLQQRKIINNAFHKPAEIFFLRASAVERQ